MRSFDPRAMVIVLGVLVAGPAWASPAQDAPPSAPVVEPLDLPDRPMPSIPSDDRLLEKEDEQRRRARCACRSPTSRWSNTTRRSCRRRSGASASRSSRRRRAATRRSSAPIFEANGEPPVLSFNDSEDPVETLRALSGDPEGREILAILIEVLEAGYVHVDAGTPEEMYIWPYFARYPVNALTPPQLVELFKLVFSGDYEDMKTYGAYISYRVGIAPDGTWRFFLVGD